MKEIKFELCDGIKWNELKKVIGFISEDIQNFHLNDNVLELELSDQADENELVIELQKISKKYIADQESFESIFDNNINIDKYHQQFKSVLYFDEGLSSFSEQSLFLYDYFNMRIEKMVFEVFEELDNAILRKLYPVMLPIHSYKKTGYLKRSPQYAIFCCSAIENMKLLNDIDKADVSEYKRLINYPRYALSPSACFHVYEEYRDKTLDNNTVITFTQSVFRNEGRFNFSEFGRMRDYHVREIVFIGDDDFVNSARDLMMNSVKKYIEKNMIKARMILASDAFILPKLQKYKKIQKIDKSKYELQVAYNDSEYMAVASFNLHGKAFSMPFNIKVNGKDTVTGCIGFGLERFVLSFLSQYGENPNNWPDEFRKAYFS